MELHIAAEGIAWLEKEER